MFADGWAGPDILLVRLRALLAQAQGNDNAYRDYRDRYRKMANELGFEGPHAVGRGDAVTAVLPLRGGDVPVHRHRGFDPAVGGRPGGDAGSPGCARRGVAVGDPSRPWWGLVQAHWRRGVRCLPTSPKAAVDAAVAAQRALNCRCGRAFRPERPNCGGRTTSVRCSIGRPG